jgi:hypothetical protein
MIKSTTIEYWRTYRLYLLISFLLSGLFVNVGINIDSGVYTSIHRHLDSANNGGKTMTLKLYAPEGYDEINPLHKKQICNGCGTKGLGGILVPDTLWGLNITDACNIHDYMYHTGTTIEEKQEADRVFLNNMIRICTHNWTGKWYSRILHTLRTHRAWAYYVSVSQFGGPAFWAGKPSNSF